MRNELAIAYFTYRCDRVYDGSTNKYVQGKGVDYVHTCGDKEYSMDKWLYLVKKYVQEAHLEDLYMQVFKYTTNNCMWLKNQKEREIHAYDCLLSHSYEHWEDFYEQGTLNV